MSNALRSDDAALDAVMDVLSPIDKGAAGSRRYAVLPTRSRPRYLVPVAGRYARGAHIRPAIAQGRGPRSRALVGQALSVGGGRLLPGTVRVDDGSDRDPSLRRHLAELFDREDIDVAIALGAPRANRKPVIQVIAGDGSTVAWVKLGVDDYTDQLVAHEADALSRPPRAPVVVPPLLASGRWRRHQFVALGHLDIVQTGDELPVTADVVQAIAGALTSEEPAGGTWWRHLRAVAGDNGTDPRRRIGGLLDLLEAELADRQWMFGAWHGDLAPWNARWENGSIYVWDWERATSPVPVGLDLIHNRFQLAMLRDGASAGAALQAAAAAESDTLQELGYASDEAWLVALAYAATLRVRLAEDARFGPLGHAASAMAESIDTDPVLRSERPL